MCERAVSGDAKVHRGRETHPAVSARTFEFATSVWLRCKSFLIVFVIYPSPRRDPCISLSLHGISTNRAGPRTSGGNAYHERNAIINPNVEKKKVRPYMLIGFKTGIDRALWLAGFIAGADQRW